MNAALWLAVGTAAGVLVGVALAERGGTRRMLGRLSGALRLFERFSGQIEGRQRPSATTGQPSSDDDLDDGGFETADEYGEAGFESDDGVEYYDDADFDGAEEHIDERVLAAFEQDPILSERDIEIEEPEPAVIALSGKVATMADAKHAVTIARGVPGVARVESYIKVRHRAPVSPPPEEADV